MATVWIPALLRDLTDGQDVVSVRAATVGEIVAQLELMYPGIRHRLCDGDSLRPGLAVAVGTEIAALGLLQRVADDAEVHFLPAIGGGVA